VQPDAIRSPRPIPGIEWIGSPTDAAAVVAKALRRSAPLCNRNTATMPVIIGFLAFSIRNMRSRVLRLENTRSARFIGIVAVLRFESPLLGKVAPKGVLELCQVIALGRPVPDTD
jgi:hypothetical protein